VKDIIEVPRARNPGSQEGTAELRGLEQGKEKKRCEKSGANEWDRVF